MAVSFIGSENRKAQAKPLARHWQTCHKMVEEPKDEGA